MSDPSPPNVPLVFAAIQHVMEDVAKIGVGKSKTNTQQNFKYRGIDDVMDALAPLLPKHALVILPSVLEHHVTERESRAGGKLFHALLKLQYEFVSPLDASVKIVGPFYGEAMDAGDKSISKAMSIAYKTMCCQSFNIPVTGLPDPDAEVHEIAGTQGRGESSPADKSPPSASANAAASPVRSGTSPLHPDDVPQSADGKPKVLRPGGEFGYGKKFLQTPINVMTTRDLEWFLGAERTPDPVRNKIAIELAWRQWETRQLEESRERERIENEQQLVDEHIP